MKSRIMSALLAAAVSVSALGFSAPAASAAELSDLVDPTTVTDKAVLSADFLGPSTNGSGPNLYDDSGGNTYADGMTTADAGKIFWVGIAVTDPYKLTANFTEGGIYNMEIALDYNPNYIVPCPDLVSGVDTVTGDDETDWIATLAKHNLYDSAAGGYDAALYWDSNSYEILADATAMAVDPVVDPDYREQSANPNDRMMVINIRILETPAGELRFQTKADDAAYNTGKKYLIRVPFKVADNVPADAVTADSLQMALGPTTFVLGSAPDGVMPYAAWEKTAEDGTGKIDPRTNLRNYFAEWNGDIPVFIEPESEDDKKLENIRVFEYIEETEGGTDSGDSGDSGDTGGSTAAPVPEEFDLYHDEIMDGSGTGFEKDDLVDTEYWVTVPYRVTKVHLLLYPQFATADLPTITISADLPDTTLTDQTPPELELQPVTWDDDGLDYTDTGPISPEVPDPDAAADAEVKTKYELVPLERGDVQADKSGGFRNTIKITAYGVDYIIHIRRLLEPTVDLAYGNSVYGRIMSDKTLVVENDPVQTEANRQAEKDLFEKYYDGDRLNTNHWYKSPEDPSQLVRYKGDENDYDEYIYFKMIMDDDGESLSCTALVDPGFTAYDEYGRGLDASKVEREITVLRTTLDNNRHFYLELGETGVVEEQPYTARGTDAFEEFHDESRIVPDVYNMFYYLLDAEGNYVLDDDGNKVELGIRKIGVVYPRGDVDLSGSVNVNDTNYMRNEVAEIDGMRLHKKYFYMARISDVDVSGSYNVNDKNAIQNHDKMVSGADIYNYFTN